MPTAIDAIMWNVDTVITDGIDMPGLGIDGTPEYAAWCETLGDAGQVFLEHFLRNQVFRNIFWHRI